MQSLNIETKNTSLKLCPQFGGCVTDWAVGNHAILRAGLGSDPRDMGAFPLFPFSGRINNGQFNWQNKVYNLPPNMAPEPHAIHGQGWQADWQFSSSAPHMAHLSYHHKGDIWPWAYRAEQDFALQDNSLVWTGRLTNLGQNPMPAGFGWHPYFPRHNAHIKADVSGVWLSDETMIPKAPEPLGALNQVTEGFTADALPLDFAFVRGASHVDAPVAQIVYPHYTLNIYADAIFNTLVIFTPKDADFFCIEPVSHAPDAVNSTLDHAITGLKTLAPNAMIQGQIRLEILHKD